MSLVGCGVLVAPAAMAADPPGGDARVKPLHAATPQPQQAVAKAGTSTVLGQTTFTVLAGCNGTAPFAVAPNTLGAGAAYTSPSAGVVTSWSTVGGGPAGSSRLLFFAPGAGAGQKTLVAKSALQPVASTFGIVYTFPVRIPVQAGWQLGVGVTSNSQACALNAGIAGDAIYSMQGFNADTMTAFTGTSTANYRPDISAVLESDADSDGFGDVTQDLCPSSAATQAACPAPDTTITKPPAKKSAKRTVKVKFTSTIAGSTFTCAVDAKAPKPCTSPFKKKVKIGKHVVLIAATSPFGTVDPTPATAKFKILSS